MPSELECIVFTFTLWPGIQDRFSIASRQSLSAMLSSAVGFPSM